VIELDTAPSNTSSPSGFWLDAEGTMTSFVELEDPMSSARGVLNALMLAVPVWGLIGTAIWRVSAA
jgi:hypothetical protein